jgi:hypothetical protein
MLAKLSSAAVAPAPEISMAAAGETAAASGRPVTASSDAQAMARRTFKAFAPLGGSRFRFAEDARAILVKVGLEPAPLVLGSILGPLMEENLRRSLVLSRGDPMIFITRPLSLALLLLLAATVVLLVAVPQFRKTREAAFQE